MKLKKIELNFGDLMKLNVQLKKGELHNIEINEELAFMIKDKVKSISRIGKKSYSISSSKHIMQLGKCTMNYRVNNGWTIITITAYIMHDVLIINKTNGDTNENTKYFFKII